MDELSRKNTGVSKKFYLSSNIELFRLCSVAVKSFSSVHHFVCVGDSAGTAFMLQKPPEIKSSTEAEIRAMQSYIQREQLHQNYVAKKQEERFNFNPFYRIVENFNSPSLNRSFFIFCHTTPEKKDFPSKFDC